MTKVLIVEDDELIADGMAQHLTASGLEPMRVAAISPDGKRMAWKGNSKDDTFRVLDIESKKQIGEFLSIPWSGGFRFSPDSRFLAVGGHGASHL